MTESCGIVEAKLQETLTSICGTGSVRRVQKTVSTCCSGQVCSKNQYTDGLNLVSKLCTELYGM